MPLTVIVPPKNGLPVTISRFVVPFVTVPPPLTAAAMLKGICKVSPLPQFATNVPVPELTLFGIVTVELKLPLTAPPVVVPFNEVLTPLLPTTVKEIG